MSTDINASQTSEIALELGLLGYQATMYTVVLVHYCTTATYYEWAKLQKHVNKLLELVPYNKYAFLP